MSNHLKIFLVAVAVSLNAAIFWWRLTNTSEALPVSPRRPIDFGEQQASLLVEWNRAEKLPLSSEGIDSFVEHIEWGKCISAPAQMKVLPLETIADNIRDEFKVAAKGLISAYAEGTPDALARYMFERGQRLSPLMAGELRKLLATDGGLLEEELAALNDHEVLVTFANKARFAPHWTALARGTACAVMWQVPQNATISRSDALGGEMAGLFKNQTRFNHIFVDADEALSSSSTVSVTPSNTAFTYYGDFRFIVEHDEEYLREMSPYFVRFGFNAEDAIWQPLELVHIATSSGNSPILVF